MPGAGSTPYDSADYVLNICRSLGNDAIQSIAGNLLADSKPYVEVFLNSGYRYLQRKLANAGYSTFKKRDYIYSVPVAAEVDPALECVLSYTGYFNGSVNAPTPTLPADMCWPLKLRERQSGTTMMLQPMYEARDGLVSRPQSLWIRDWYWRGETIVMRGAIQVNDLEILYTPFLPDLSITSSPVSQVMILRSENALAAYTLWAYAFARGSLQADTILQMGDRFLTEMLSSDTNLKQRGNLRRQPYSRRAHFGWGWF